MNILYATDGSESAAAAGRLLASLPLPPGARVTVLTATAEPGWTTAAPVGVDVSLYPWLVELAVEQEAWALQAAEAAATPIRGRGFEVKAITLRQSPASAILDQAQEENSDLIVVGSHGLGAIERFLIGSVSERVARYAHCSVLVARADTVRRAIIAVDGSESAEEALAALVRLPLPEAMEMTLVSVLRPGELPPALQLDPGISAETVAAQYDQTRENTGLRIARHAQDRLRQAGREAAIDGRSGAPAEELIAAARETGADLIVTGSANRSALGRLFLGSVSGRVLSHAPCSVLIARAGAEVEGPAT